ncbi:MAG TPA: hypothetical protein PKE26_10860 [Kiritimatiellia bacterium]|nr:hypothetical protein [Kiritimatiellia bacterium]
MNENRPTRAPLFLLLLLLLAAGGIRLYLAIQAHVPTLDTAVVGQMAVNILKGDRPLFFAGQNYMGALEAYALALVFLVVPPGRVSMTLVTIAFALAWTIAVYLFFRRRHGAWAGLAAATVPAFPGWPVFWYTTAPYGGYPQTYFFGTILLLLALPFLDRKPFRPGPRHALLLAAITGLALWTNLQVAPYVGAAAIAGLVAFVRRPRPWSAWWPYLLIPAAMALAFLPQLLAEASHVHPPMFDGFSRKAAARSWRALIEHDLPRSLFWLYPPEQLHRIMAIIFTCAASGILLLARRPRTGGPSASGTFMLVVLMIAFFAVTYFPHPMSGYVPRYLNAPLSLLLSAGLAGWVGAEFRALRRIGAALAALLLLYNAVGILSAARVRGPTELQTLHRFEQAIDVARDGGWSAVMLTGSEVEGYDGARLTFLAGGRPVFASAFSDRFLDHQLAWEFGEYAGYSTRRRHLPFVEGSLNALGIGEIAIHTTDADALFTVPEVRRYHERSIIPDGIDGWEREPNNHPLFDRRAATTWPDEGTSNRLIVHLDAPVSFAGLRASAGQPSALPYRYTIRILREDGTWVEAQSSDRRIAGTYLSGTRVYFRGHHPWMDIRFPPIIGTAMEWTLLPGPDNPTPPKLIDLHVLTSHGEAWPEWDAIVTPEFEAKLTALSPETVVAERGLQRALRKGIRDPALRTQLPLPYNPRFGRTQPERFVLPYGTIHLWIESTYRESALRVLQRNGIAYELNDDQTPFTLITLSNAPPEANPLSWNGFQIMD